MNTDMYEYDNIINILEKYPNIKMALLKCANNPEEYEDILNELNKLIEKLNNKGSD